MRCNRRYEEMYGYGPGELEGKPTSVLYANPADLENAGSAYDAAARAAAPRAASSRASARTARVFWTRADGRAVDPQDPLKGSVWTVEDVTEQRRAEDELQRVLAEQQALLDNVVVGIAISRERKVVRCNRRFEEMFGFGRRRSERRLVAADVLHRRGIRAARLDLRRDRPGPHARARAVAAPPGRLGLLVPRLGPRGRRRRSRRAAMSG